MTSLPGHFRSRGHVTSFPVTWLPPPASYSPVGAQTYPKLDLLAFYSHFQVTSSLMTPLPGHLRSLPVMFAFPVTWLLPLASYSPVGAQTYPKLDLYAFNSHFQVTSYQIRHFRVTSGYFRSRYVISCHVAATSCELQPCRS